jgi:ribonuclease R
MPIDKSKILALMREKTYRPLLMKELMRELAAPKDERQDFKHAVRELIADGEVVKIRGNRYGLPEKMNLVIGKLSAHPDGYGFVMPDKEGAKDVYIRSQNLMGAMHGDRVVARIEGGMGGFRGEGRQEGRVIRVLERASTSVVGKYEAGRGFGVVVSTNPRLTQDFYISPKARGGAKDGDIVVADIVRYPEVHRSPEAEVVRVLGKPGEPGIDTDVVIEEHGLATRFSEETLAEARAIPQKLSAAMKRDRRDLRDMQIVTIDGERARDFDDAVCVEALKGGLIRLYVSIADVAHYVRPGTSLDEVARARATSVYFPDRVLPMLPEELSNGICSLNPGVERLTLTAEMVFNEKGERVGYELYESVITSRERMTYTDVAAIIEGDDRGTKERYAGLVEQFMLMRELMERLNRMRRRRGSIDFDLPEPEVILDLMGKTAAIIKAERNEAHRVIEEFMLAANETVAFHLESHGVPLLYRVHEEPDEEKMEELGELVKGFGLPWPTSGNIRPKHLAQLIEKIKGRPEERYLNTVILRSMKLAKYTPENVGHFGLASRCYCHFTSPIRRYPDLTVHRALKELLSKKSIPGDRKSALAAELPALGQHTSFMEREAEEAEREVVQLKKLQFMLDKVGAEFTGFVTGVTAFGFFVELEEYFVEGLVRLTSLYDDYYTYQERRHALVGEHTGRVFRLGDRVAVTVERVDLERRHMDFSVAGLSQGRAFRPEPVWIKHRDRGRRR